MTHSLSDQELWTAVDSYITSTIVERDPVLDAALAHSDVSGLPPIAVSATHGKFLALLATIRGAKNILEIGTLGGFSTICLARTLPAEGRLISLEADAKHAEVARTNLERAGLSEVVQVRVGSALDTLPLLVREGAGPFDFVFIDADKASIPDYVEWALALTRPGSVIVVDNMVRRGAILDAASGNPDVQGIRRLHENLAHDKRVSATTVQTVGSKGYDGFTLIVVAAG
jgi:predicted O-methyltransferase YrrM